jgi:uncharacterized integral membrane protein
VADERSSRGVSPGVAIAAILAVLLLVFIFQNTDEVRVTAYFWDFTGPLWLVLLVTVAVGLVILELFNTLLRRRRR